MKIISTNRATPVTIAWKGGEQTTGIFKRPRAEGIFLKPEGVQGDTVGNPEVHGGRYKACYLFAAETYAHWQGQYPGLAWEYGMFGENLSVTGLDEGRLTIGSVFRLGDARIRITTPREPCSSPSGGPVPMPKYWKPGGYGQEMCWCRKARLRMP